MKSFCKPAILLAPVLFLCFSCGYAIRPDTVRGISTINVSVFENRTYEHGMEIELASLIAREFIEDGALAVSSPRNADIIMRGKILEYTLEPYAFGPAEADVRQYRLAVKASVRAESPGGEVLWDEDGIEGEHVFFTYGALAMTENAAASRALRDLAVRIVERTVRRW